MMEIKSPYWHPSAVSGFLLDWDGVIAETKLDFTGVRQRYYGGRNAYLLEEADTLLPDDRKGLMDDLRDLEVAGASRAVPVPGALDLLKWLNAHKIPYCIVSRNCPESIELAAKTIGVKLPKHVWHRDNSKFLKPDPRGLLNAAASIGVEPRDCLFIGDYIYDMQGSRRAGIRSVLVQRNGEGWCDWYDVYYEKLADLAAELDEPKPLVPWEYREIHAKRGDKWLNGAWPLTLVLPDSCSPTLDCWLARAASFAVGTISVPSDAVLSPTDWKANSSLAPSMMGRRIADVATDFLAPRYPLTKVVTDVEGLKAPKNSLDLMRFIERKIF